jgi:hypothetical protein
VVPRAPGKIFAPRQKKGQGFCARFSPLYVESASGFFQDRDAFSQPTPVTSFSERTTIMSRSWLRQLCGRLLGDTRTARPVRRKRASARLGVEALEERLVLSVVPVAQVTDATGTTFVVDGTSHMVFESVRGGPSTNAAFSNCSSLVSDGIGDVFALNFHDHTVYEHIQGATGNGSWTFGGISNISSLVSDAQGDVFALSGSGLGGDGRVYQLAQGTIQWNYANAYNITSLVRDGSGNIFVLSDGDGHKVFELTDPAALNWSDTGAYNVSGLVSDAEGDLFAYSEPVYRGNGDVWEMPHNSPGTWNDTGMAVNSYTFLVTDTFGDVFVLRTDNNVYRFIQGNDGTNVSPWTQVDSGVSELSASIFGLLDFGNGVARYSATGQPGTWQVSLDYNNDPNNNVIVSAVAGIDGMATANRWDHLHPATEMTSWLGGEPGSWFRSVVAPTTTATGLAAVNRGSGAENVYQVWTDGNLYAGHLDLTSGQWEYVPLGNPGVGFASGPVAIANGGGDDYFLTGTDGNLYVGHFDLPNEGQPWTNLGNPGGVTFASGPVAIQYGGDINAFLTGTDGHLYADHRDPSTGHWGWVDLGSPGVGLASGPAVINFGSEENVFVTGTDGNLYIDGYLPGSGSGGWANDWGWAGGLGNPGGVSFASGPVALGFTAYQDVFFTGADGNLYVDQWDGVARHWGWVNLGNPGGVTFAGGPAIMNYGCDSRSPNIFLTGTDGNLYVDHFDPQNPNNARWEALGNPGTSFANGPAAIYVGCDDNVFLTGTDGNLYRDHWDPSAPQWNWAPSLGNPGTALQSFTGSSPESVQLDRATATVALGPGPTQVQVLVDRTGGTGGTVQVPFQVNGSGLGADFTVVTPSPLLFQPGEAQKTLTLTVTPHSPAGPDGPLTVTLGTPTSPDNSATVSLGLTGTDTVTILEPETFVISGPSSVGHNAGTVTYTVGRLAGSAADGTATVKYTVSGPAVAGGEYQGPTSGTLTIGPGAHGTITLPISNSGQFVGDQALTVTLTSVTLVGSTRSVASVPSAATTTIHETNPHTSPAEGQALAALAQGFQNAAAYYQRHAASPHAFAAYLDSYNAWEWASQAATTHSAQAWQLACIYAQQAFTAVSQDPGWTADGNAVDAYLWDVQGFEWGLQAYNDTLPNG